MDIIDAAIRRYVSVYVPSSNIFPTAPADNANVFRRYFLNCITRGTDDLVHDTTLSITISILLGVKAVHERGLLVCCLVGASCAEVEVV